MKYFGEWLVIIGYTALVFVLVRPGSQGPTFVTSVGNAMIGLTNASTGGGGWSAK